MIPAATQPVRNMKEPLKTKQTNIHEKEDDERPISKEVDFMELLEREMRK